MPDALDNTQRRKPVRKLGLQPVKRPSVGRYADYRLFMRDMFAHLKSKNPAFSYRLLAEACGLRSPAFIHLVINAKRNFGKDAITVAAVARGLGLSEREAKLFSDLVAMNQARDADQRNRQLKKLVRRRSFREGNRIDGDLFAFLQSWRAVAIHAMADMEGFRADADWVSERFLFITRKEAQEALDLLFRLKLLSLRGDGTVISTQPHLSTGDEVRHEIVRLYHMNALAVAARALETLPAGKRNFGAVTARIPKERFAEVGAYLHRMRNEFHAFVTGLETADGDMVLQTNFQMFPLTKVEME